MNIILTSSQLFIIFRYQYALEHQELLLKDIDPQSKDSKKPHKLTFSEVANQWHQKNKHLWKDLTRNRHSKVYYGTGNFVSQSFCITPNQVEVAIISWFHKQLHVKAL